MRLRNLTVGSLYEVRFQYGSSLIKVMAKLDRIDSTPVADRPLFFMAADGSEYQWRSSRHVVRPWSVVQAEIREAVKVAEKARQTQEDRQAAADEDVRKWSQAFDGIKVPNNRTEDAGFELRWGFITCENDTIELPREFFKAVADLITAQQQQILDLASQGTWGAPEPTPEPERTLVIDTEGQR
jgi:hypothetical protein